MSIILSSLKEEKTNEEYYNDIIGGNFIGRTKEELYGDIEAAIQNNFTSRIEQRRLLDLLQKIYYENNH